MFNSMIHDETGFVVSAELALIVTLIFTGVAVGMAVARDALVMELNDISEMFGTVSQSYNVTGLSKPRNNGRFHAECSGFGYNDGQDECDCKKVNLFNVCGKDDPSNNGIDNESL